MVADIQGWVSNPAGNFGWAIRGNEVTTGVAHRFNSRENGSNPPVLILTFDVPTPTPSPTATPIPTINISGTLTYCPNPAADPVPGVTLNLTGDTTTSVVSDGAGAYQFLSLNAGGNYVVTPSKAALAPSSSGITTVDVIATQRHFLGITLLTGCRLTAADVNGDSNVTTVDVIAIQRFFLGQATGIANVGKYQFSPASRSYNGSLTDQNGQDYNALVLGDVASPFIH